MEIKVKAVNINQDFLNKFCEDLVDEMLNVAEEKVVAGLSSHIDTGETIASITKKRVGNKGELSVGGAAVWLEFGTGVAYNSSLHPKASELGMSAHGTYSQTGSGVSLGSNPNGWWYPSPKGWWIPKSGKYAGQPMAKTKGIAQTRFMYNAGEYLKQNAQEIASKVASKWNK